MTLICFRTITTKSRAPDVVVKNLFDIEQSSQLIDDSANDVEVGGLDEKAKPIPFLIRNTTADGMPISIGSLKAVDTPAFSSFNPFIKRLPPPKKYVFEPRQVLPGDIVDPYNYLRALFRGEVILTSNKLPTFASPRVWGMTTASTLRKNTGSFTTRSPQGFNPWLFNKKSEVTTTTTAAPSSLFGGNIDHNSRGVGTDVEHVPLPVGMLGTPAPNFNNFNFKDFVEKMKNKKAIGGEIKTDVMALADKQSGQSVVTSATPSPTTLDNFITNIKNKQAPTLKSFMKNFKENKKEFPSLENVMNVLKSKNVQTIEDVMKKIVTKTSFNSFSSIPAVPQQTEDPRFAVVPAVPKVNTRTEFKAIPAVPSHQESLTKLFPKFQHFPASTEKSLEFMKNIKAKQLSFEPFKAISEERKSEALQKLKDIMTKTDVESSSKSKDISAKSESIFINNPERYETSFTSSTPRSFERNTDFLTKSKATTTFRPRQPHGTIRSEIMSILKKSKTTTAKPTERSTKSQLFELLQLKSNQPTEAPEIQQTTSRTEVLKLLQHLLQSVKPSTTTARTPARVPTTTVTTKSWKSPSLRFDDGPTPLSKLSIDLTPPPMSSVTTASPVHPRSPFPHMEPPQHDLLTSNIYLPHPLEAVTPASTVHPNSPFQHLEPPGSLEFEDPSLDFFPTPGSVDSGFLTGTFDNPGHAVPRSGRVLPYDPARPHLPPQNPTEKPGQFRLFLDSSSNIRNGRKFSDHPQFSPQNRGLKPQMFPVPRTRMIAPESHHPATNRRLAIDGPTEKSLTPLEILAKGTVPTLKPDTSFFGTPKSRQQDSQSPLEQITAGLRENNFGFDEIQPLERIRFQRKEGENQPSHSNIRQQPYPPSGSLQFGNEKAKEMKILTQSSDYERLPGVKTGTTAVGLVEHRNNNQPLFHVPIFTTPIPKNGQFIKKDQSTLSRFQSGLKSLTSAISESVKLPNIPSPQEGFQRLKSMFGGNVGAAQELKTIHITPKPRKPPIRNNFQNIQGHLSSNSIGRRLDTFSRYTKIGHFGNSAINHYIDYQAIVLCIFISGFIY